MYKLIHMTNWFLHLIALCSAFQKHDYSMNRSTAPPPDQGLLIIKASLSHPDITHSAWLLWKNDRPVAETFTWKHTTLTKDGHPCSGGIRTHNDKKQAAADPHPRARGHYVLNMGCQNEMKCRRFRTGLCCLFTKRQLQRCRLPLWQQNITMCVRTVVMVPPHTNCSGLSFALEIQDV